MRKLRSRGELSLCRLSGMCDSESVASGMTFLKQYLKFTARLSVGNSNL